MKTSTRHLLAVRSALAALPALAAAAAHAQAGPTGFQPQLFGVVDVGVRAVRNGDAPTYRSESTDGLSSSRLGVRGSEDLGDGLRAAFWLEAPVNADTGTSNSSKFFNRRSTVSLVHPQLGEVRLGRDNTPLYLAYSTYDPFGTNGLASITGSFVAGGTGIVSGLGSGSQVLSRADNQLSWFLPPGLAGVYGQLSVAPAEGTVGNRYDGVRLGIARGPFDVSAGWEQTRVANDGRLKQWHAGAAWDAKVVKVSGQVLRSTWAEAPGGERRQTVLQLGLSAPFGRHQLRADVIRGDMQGGAGNAAGYRDDDDATQFAIGWQYNVSKRTAVYATAATLRNRGASRLMLSSSTAGMQNGQNSTGAELGVRHSF